MGYHFFKRRDYSEIGSPIGGPELDRGFRILGSILRFGLLLKPEARTGARKSIPRICFTEETLDRLCEPVVDIEGAPRSHFEIFGPFAIGIDNRLARLLGLCAVLSKAGPVSDKLFGCLSQIHGTLALLAHVESLAHPDHDNHAGRGYALPWERLASIGVGLRTHNEHHGRLVFAALERLSDHAEDIERMFEALDSDRLPFWQLAQFIALLADLEQDADSRVNNRHLAYYRQREWRIQRTFYRGVGVVPLSAEEAARFGAACDADAAYRRAFKEYWREDYTGGPDEWLLTDVEVDPNARRRRISEIINEIVYPEAYDQKVRALVTMLQSEGDQLTAKLRPYPIGKRHDEIREHFAMDCRG